MKTLSFLDKTRTLLAYTDRYETITLFEITQNYGSSLARFLAFVCSLPQLLLPVQLITLPSCFLIMVFCAFMLFDEEVWLFDVLKRKALPSPTVKKMVSSLITALEKLLQFLPKGSIYEQYETIFSTVNPLLLVLGSLQVGFLQGPSVSYFSILSLAVISLGYLIENGYLCILGYVFLFIGLT